MKSIYNLDFARANKIRIKGNRRIVSCLVWITGVSAITGCSLARSGTNMEDAAAEIVDGSISDPVSRVCLLYQCSLDQTLPRSSSNIGRPHSKQ